jgi:hypothetical protein
MSIFIAGEKVNNFYVGYNNNDGTRVNTAYIAGEKVYSNVIPGDYIATSPGSNRPIYLYENIDGVKGALVKTIGEFDWTTIARYAPYIAIAESNICAGWGKGKLSCQETLDFAKLTRVSDNFLQDANFIGTLLLPKLETAGDLMLDSTYKINHDLSFPNLTSVGYGFFFMVNGFAKKITFGKLVMSSNFTRFWYCNSATWPGRPTLEFQAVQTLTTAPTDTFIWYASRIHLRLPDGSAGVDVANKKWLGLEWGSVTLI